MNDECMSVNSVENKESKNVNNDLCTCSVGNCYLRQSCLMGKTVFALQNVRSLLPKIDQIRWFLKQHPIDFLCVNETWLTDTVDNAEIFVEGYNIVRKDRNISSLKKKSVGGGVLIYVKDALSYKVRDDININDIECVWIEVKSPGIQPFLVSTFYRPPSVAKSYDDEIKICIEKAAMDNKQMYISGDFNIDYNTNKSNLINYIENLHNIKQMVHFDTRVTPKSSTCIDLILTSTPKQHIETKPLKLGLSDHYMVYTIIDLKIKHSYLNHKYATFRSYKKFNENVFIDDVQKSFVNSVFDKNDMNGSWEEWKCKFLAICDKHAPIRKMRVKN